MKKGIIIFIAIILMFFLFKNGFVQLKEQVIICPGGSGCPTPCEISGTAGASLIITPVDCATGDLNIMHNRAVCWDTTIIAKPGWSGSVYKYAIDEEITQLSWEDIPYSSNNACPSGSELRNGSLRRFTDRVEGLLPGFHKFRFGALSYQESPQCAGEIPACTYDVAFNIQPEPCALGPGQGLASKTYGPGANISKSSLEGIFNKFCSQFPPFVLNSFTLTGSQDYLILEKLINDQSIKVPNNAIVKLFWVIDNPLVQCKIENGEAYSYDLDLCSNLIDISFCSEGNLISAGDGYACLTETIIQCYTDSPCPSPCTGMTASCVNSKCGYSGQCEPQIKEIIADCTSLFKTCPSGFTCIETGAESGLCKKTEYVKEYVNQTIIKEKIIEKESKINPYVIGGAIIIIGLGGYWLYRRKS